MADNIITGRKYRIKATENTWDLISYWTKSQDVEMDDGTNLLTSFSNLKTQADNSKTINTIATLVRTLFFLTFPSKSSNPSKSDLLNVIEFV